MTADAEPVERLIAAWEAWDRAPKTLDLVVRKQAAVGAVVVPDRLRLVRRIEQLRREGHTVRRAVTKAVDEQTSDRPADDETEDNPR